MANSIKPSMKEFFEWDDDGYPIKENPEEGMGSKHGSSSDTQVESNVEIQVREFNIDELLKDDPELARLLGREAAARLIAMTIERESKGKIRFKDLGQDKIDED